LLYERGLAAKEPNTIKLNSPARYMSQDFAYEGPVSPKISGINHMKSPNTVSQRANKKKFESPQNQNLQKYMTASRN
jgi:hypothetical protein